MSEMVFIYILFFAVLVLAGVCGIMAKKIDELTVELNQQGTAIANYSLVLHNTSELTKANDVAIEELTGKLNSVSGQIKDLPIDEFIETQKQETAYLQGIQNIFNYGGEVQRLNVEALKHE